MSSPVKDATIALGAVLTLLTIWSFVDSSKSGEKSNRQLKLLHAKMDKILAKIESK